MRSAQLHHHEPAAPGGGAEASDRYVFDGPSTARWSVDVRSVTGFEE